MRPAPHVFFPNVVFTLVRSGVHRAAGMFVFRVPRHLNKLDIQQYLEGVYPAVRVARIETTNFLKHETRGGARTIPAKKQAVVTLSCARTGGPYVFAHPPEASEAEVAAWARTYGVLPDPNNHPRAHPAAPVRIIDRHSPHLV